MEYKIIKSNKPIVFLDTFFLIDIFKKKKEDHTKKLFEILKSKINENKIICPLGEQTTEIFDKERSDIIHNFNLIIAKGSQFRTVSDIYDKQFYQAIDNYIEKKKIYNINYDDSIYYYPKNNAVISSVMNTKSVINFFKNSKNNKTEIINNKLKKYKNNFDNIPFEEQLNAEYLSLHDKTSEYFNKGLNIGVLKNYIHYLNYWLDKNKSANAYLSFLKSEFYKKIPHVYINANLYASIVSSKNKLQSGDINDIKYISAYLPYCNYFLTDKAQHNRINRLEIDKIFNTEVYCLKNIDKFINKIEVL